MRTRTRVVDENPYQCPSSKRAASRYCGVRESVKRLMLMYLDSELGWLAVKNKDSIACLVFPKISFAYYLGCLE
jgi:hypothetical protein